MSADDDNAFANERTADCYRFRPDYPRALYRRLPRLVATRNPDANTLLDMGCGTGKIARGLAQAFDQVDAVDPSRAMRSLGQSLPGGQAANLHWITGAAETAALPHAPYGLVVAAASIHWMDQDRVFSRLRQVSPRSVIAIVDGDAAWNPPWQDAWQDFMSRWIPKLTGIEFGAKAFNQRMRRYTQHVAVQGEEAFVSEPVTQTVAEFILCQHSRSTFTHRRLGPDLAAFDAELEALLAPYSSDGRISYRVRTSLVWGAIGA